jgi:hypothetical protein
VVLYPPLYFIFARVVDFAQIQLGLFAHVRFVGTYVRMVASIWKIIMNPRDIEMEDISNVIFDTVSGVSNMRYFKSQKIELDLYEEEGEVKLRTTIITKDNYLSNN